MAHVRGKKKDCHIYTKKRGGKRTLKKNDKEPNLYTFFLLTTTTPVDRPTPSSTEHLKKVLQPPMKDTSLTTNRLMSVRLRMVK